MLGRTLFTTFFLLLCTLVTIPALPIPKAQLQSNARATLPQPKPMMRLRNKRRFTSTPTVKRDILDRFITNAQRLTNGLSPLPPAWKAFKGKRTLKRRQGPGSPSAVVPPPPTPTVVFEPQVGYFGLTNAEGDPVGYLNQKANRFGLLVNNRTGSDSVRFRFWVRSGYTNTSYANIYMENWDSGAGEAFPLLGLIHPTPGNGTTEGTADLSDILARDNDTNDDDADEPIVLFLGGIEIPEDPTITTPQNLNNSFTHTTNISSEAEPNAWSIDIASGDVIAQWTDAHGHRIPTQMVLVNDTLVATNNVTHLNSTLTKYETFTPVTLHFVTET